MAFFDRVPTASPFVRPDRFIERVWLDWLASGGFDAAVADTRPNRVNFAASDYPRKFYFETDTHLLYVSDGTSWKYVAGFWRNKVANKPSSGGATAWSGATAYVVGDLASRLGVDYYCFTAHTNHQPPSTAYWYAIPALGTNDTGLRFQATDTTQRYVWTGTGWVEDYALTDAATNAVSVLIRLVHLTTGVAAAGFGSRILSDMQDASGNQDNASALDTEWTTATNGAEVSTWSVLLRSAGAALAKFFKVLTTGIAFGVGGFFGKLTHANTADRVYTFADADGNIVYATSTMTDHAIALGNGSQKVKPGPLGTTSTLLHGNAAGDPSYAAVDLAAEVGTSILPKANGGTGINNTTQTYTPTLSNTLNIDSSTAFLCMYTRVGDIVTVSGQVSVDATAVTNTQMEITLPIASDLQVAEDLAGTANNGDIGGLSARISADTAGNRAAMQWVPSYTASALLYSFVFQYRVR